MSGPPEQTEPDPDDAEPRRYILAPGARRALSETLPAAAAFAAWEFINGPLLRQPHRVGAPLRGPFKGLWRARRGEYRVRYRIDDNRHEIHVLDVNHRIDCHILGDDSSALRWPMPRRGSPQVARKQLTGRSRLASRPSDSSDAS